MKSMNTKKARLSFVIGLAASSLIMGSTAQASNELPAGAFLVAKRSADDGDRSERPMTDAAAAVVTVAVRPHVMVTARATATATNDVSAAAIQAMTIAIPVVAVGMIVVSKVMNVTARVAAAKPQAGQ